METKEDLIKATTRQLIRIAKMYARIEAMPVPVRDDIAVSTREAHAIQAIGEQEPVSVTQVANRFGISKSAASQTVSRLTKKGFLHKKQAPHSAKEFELSLTALGWEAFAAHEQFHGEDMAQLIDSLSGYSISQIATLSVLLETLGEVMGQRLSPPTKE